MKRILLFHRQRLLASLVLFILVLSACTSAAPPDATMSGSATEAATPAGAEETEINSDEEAAAINEAAAAQESFGVTVTSDEDVSTPRQNYGGVYHEVTAADAATFHPYLAVETASFAYIGNVYDCCLLRRDPDTLDLIPNMAESYSISDDGLTFTFHLRQNMQWSDGTPLTAQDFKWTYDQVVKPENEYPYLSDLDFIVSYEAPDDYTLVIQTAQLYAPALDKASYSITPLPKHIWENLDWLDPESNPEINSPSVVSGPYKLVEWNRDQNATFEANESYWYKGRPNFDQRIVEIVPDQDVGFEMLKSGDVDNADITPEMLAEARSLENVTVYEWWPVSSNLVYIGFNLREGALTSDLHLRRGINYAIDKELLVDEALLGTAKRVCSTYPDTSWVYEPNVECYAYSVESALAEFEQAGYTYDGEKLLDGDGNQLTLRYAYGPNTDKTTELIAVTVQDYLSKVGIAVELQPYDWATFMDVLAAEEPDWDMHYVGWQAGVEPDDMKFIWQSAYIPDLNSHAYNNPDIDRLFDEAAATYDKEVRIAKYQEIQRILAEDAPMVFLYYSKAWSGQNNRVRGIEPKPVGITWNNLDWYLEE